MPDAHHISNDDDVTFIHEGKFLTGICIGQGCPKGKKYDLAILVDRLVYYITRLEVTEVKKFV